LASLGLVEVAASGLISEGLAAGGEYLVSNKVEILITFVETLVDCPDCTTAEDFAVQFAVNYAANVAIGKITGTILNTTTAQKVGAYMYQKFVAAGTNVVAATKKALVPIIELKNKTLNYADNVWSKVRGRLITSKYIYDVSDITKILSLLKTKPNTAFFWSGRTNGIGGEAIALEIAQKRGGMTLEGLIAQNKIIMPQWDINNPKIVQVWETVSEWYAKQVTGEVRAVIGKELRPGNIWETKELQRLKENMNVTKIIIIDPYTLVETIIFKR